MAATDNRGPQLQAVCYTLVVTAFICTVLRCLTRTLIVKSFGFDDWCMLAALVSCRQKLQELISNQATLVTD